MLQAQISVNVQEHRTRIRLKTNGPRIAIVESEKARRSSLTVAQINEDRHARYAPCHNIAIIYVLGKQHVLFVLVQANVRIERHGLFTRKLG